MSVVSNEPTSFFVLNMSESFSNLLKYSSYLVLSFCFLECSSSTYAMEEDYEEIIEVPAKRKMEEMEEEKAVSNGNEKEKEKKEEEPDLKKQKREDTPTSNAQFDLLPPEMKQQVALRIFKGGHDALIAFTKTTLAQDTEADSQFAILRRIYAPVHSGKMDIMLPFLQNLRHSIPVIEIRNAYMRKPVLFYYCPFSEESLIPFPYSNYIPEDADLKSLGSVFEALAKIDEIRFEFYKADCKSSCLPQLKSLLQYLKNSPLIRLVLAPVDLDEDHRPIYEQYFMENLWPAIKEIASLRSLKVSLENEEYVNSVVRDISLSNLPSEDLSFGYFDLKGSLADGIALLIANSPFLKTLELHDIQTDLNSLQPIITSVVRNPTFQKLQIGLYGDSNDYNGEEDAIKKLIEGSDKFEIDDFREY